MGCPVVVRGASARERRSIERLFAEREATFSRFIPASELNGVNAAAGRPVQVSPAFADMLALALEAARETDGLVDPRLGGALEAAGYDRDFTSLEPDPGPAGDPDPPPEAVIPHPKSGSGCPEPGAK
jgi:thiamine biosynthesis lipoprotein